MNAREIPWRRWIPWMMAGLVVLMVIALVLPAIQQAREAAWRSSSKNNLKQFGLAFHNYHDVYQCFPPGGVFGEDGTAFHGWGSAVWPFMESSPYYSMIDHSSPWDAPVNSYLFKQIPYGSENPKIATQYSQEGFGPSHYIGNQNLLHRNSTVTFDQMENGTSETWLITDQFQDWWPFGSPYNWTSLEWPRPGADSDHGWFGGGAHLLMADSSVKFFAAETDPSIIQALRDAPPVPSAKETVKPPNSYRFESPRWKQDRLMIDDSSSEDKAYCTAIYLPSGEIETVYCIHDKFTDEDDLSTEDIKQILKKFPESRTMRLPMTLDDQQLTLLIKNKELRTLQVDKIMLSSEGIERLKEFPTLKFLSGDMSNETLQEIRETLPDLQVKNIAYWR